MSEHSWYIFIWDKFCEILDALNRFYKALFIIGIFFLIAAFLFIMGHISGIAVSIGAVDSQDVGQKYLLIINPFAFVLLCIGGLGLIGYCIYRAKSDGATKSPSWPYPEKLTVHVVLPTNKNTYHNTLGDALLQAAGFLSASDAFDNIKIIPHDHKNNSDTAWKVLNEIIDKESEKKEPICIVFTMSSICTNVYKKCHDKIKRCSPKVKNRLSIVFTVASSPKTPYDNHYFFQHFVTGGKEIERIVHHCRTICHTLEGYVPRGLLFEMNSPYSKETAKQIKEKLENHIPLEILRLDPSNQFTNTQKDRISTFIESTQVEERFAIVVAYDKALLNSFEALNQAGYEGRIIATTTLSVKDWQEYLDRDNYWNPNKVKVCNTKVDGFDPDNTQTMFAISLKYWTFDTVIRENKKPREFYKDKYQVVKEWFDPLEREVYEKIYPNYISAFCFDSVRIFSKMQKHTQWNLSSLISECSPQELNEDSPFLQNEVFIDHGKTVVSVEIEPLKTKRTMLHTGDSMDV